MLVAVDGTTISGNGSLWTIMGHHSQVRILMGAIISLFAVADQTDVSARMHGLSPVPFNLSPGKHRVGHREAFSPVLKHSHVLACSANRLIASRFILRMCLSMHSMRAPGEVGSFQSNTAQESIPKVSSMSLDLCSCA